MASKIPGKGFLISTLSTDFRFPGEDWHALVTHWPSGPVRDMVWDKEGRLLVGQEVGRLDRLTIDQDKGHLLKAEKLLMDQPCPITSVSVNDSGDVGAVILNTKVGAVIHRTKVYLHTTTGGPRLWTPDPRISGLHCIVMFEDRYCLCSADANTKVIIYKFDNDSPLHTIPLHNEKSLSHMARIDDNRLVISELFNSDSLLLVDINTREVTRVTPKHPGGGNVLDDANGVSCDGEHTYGVSCDGENNIYVCTSKDAVHVLSPQGEYLTTLGGDLEGGLRLPYALAVCSRPGKCPLLAVFEWNSEDVKIYALTDE